MTEIREGRPEDFEGVMGLLRLMHAESGVAALDETKVSSLVQRGLRKDLSIVGVIEGDGGIEASLGIFAMPWWYSDEMHLEDLWNFVHPAHRRTTHAKQLLSFAKSVSERLDTPLLMGILSTDRTAAKVALYRRQMPEVGALFLYRA